MDQSLAFRILSFGIISLYSNSFGEPVTTSERLEAEQGNRNRILSRETEN
jgi:hypothetical protein